MSTSLSDENVTAKIINVETEIKEVKVKINKVEEEIRGARSDKEKEQLRDKENKLRDKENKLLDMLAALARPPQGEPQVACLGSPPCLPLPVLPHTPHHRIPSPIS